MKTAANGIIPVENVVEEWSILFPNLILLVDDLLLHMRILELLRGIWLVCTAIISQVCHVSSTELNSAKQSSRELDKS